MAAGKREFTVGLFALIGVIALLFLTVQIKGTSLFEKKYTLEVRYPEVAGSLTKGASVLVYGVKVGEAVDVRIEEDDAYPVRPVVLELRISQNVALYENAEIIIMESAIIGETTVVASPGSPHLPRLEDGMTIVGAERSDAIAEITRRAPEIMSEVAESVQIINAFLARLDENQAITEAVTDLASLLAFVNESMTSGEGELHTAVGNLIDFTDNINASLIRFDESVLAVRDDVRVLREEIVGTLDTIHLYSQDAFVEADRVLRHVDSTTSAISEYTSANRERWDAITINLEQTTARLNRLTGRLDEGEGSMGLLFTDEALYREFTTVLISINEWLGQLDAWLAGADRPLEERLVPYESAAPGDGAQP
jgi:phospholipid/cholesterol/gamma-HCH transport system substrate-binding protein